VFTENGGDRAAGDLVIQIGQETGGEAGAANRRTRRGLTFFRDGFWRDYYRSENSRLDASLRHGNRKPVRDATHATAITMEIPF
jgi:hypothetical protein